MNTTTITLDSIIDASRKSGISIADLVISLDKALTPTQVKPASKARAKAAKLSDKDASMAKLPASPGQFGRINRRHVALGLRTYRNLAIFREVYPTMLDASRYYASI